LNYPEFPDSCLPDLLTVLVDVSQVFIYSSHIYFKQRCNKSLRQPDGFILHTDLDGVFSGLFCEDKKFGGAVSDLECFLFGHCILSETNPLSV
jgi:hypothetical protein